jgi:prolipoprotein diacylglyceryl transferase
MVSHSWTAWFYWDPPREAFTIPFLNHPIVWYGILFVTGFIIAYFLLNPIVVRFLIQSRHLSSLDILNWPLLIETLRTSSSPLIYQFMGELNLSARQQLKQKTTPFFLTPTLQQEIVEGFNRLLQHSSLSRDNLQQVFGKALATPKQTAYFLTDRLCWFVVIGTVVGARLGAVFFYDWPYFREHPLEIFKVWHGGLASHGGFIGVILSLYFYLKYVHQWVPQLTFLRLLDYVVIPSTLVCGFIRLGNFMNQEILGTPTTMPWGVIFGHPADDSAPIPRHPVQLYEAAAYFMIFCLVWWLWKNQRLDERRPGAILGLSFILGFGTRFIFEFWKATQESIFSSSFLQMGQILSIPFILLGTFLIWHSKRVC